MTFRTSIALVAMSAALVVPAVAQAKGTGPCEVNGKNYKDCVPIVKGKHKVAKKHKAVAHKVAKPAEPQAEAGLTAAEQLQLAQQQLAQLQSQVNDLSAKTAAAPAKADVAAAASAAAAAGAKADKAAAAAASANAAAVKADKAVGLVKWAADTKVTGRAYINASSINQKNAAGATTEKDGGVAIKRLYLGVEHKFDSVFSANAVVDFFGGTQTSAAGAAAAVYVKNAYLEAKLSPAAVVRLGAAGTPWIPYEESIQGYRHVEKTYSDLAGVGGQSADWGVHVGGDLAGGAVSYAVSATDGAGYKNPKLTQTIDLEGRLSTQFNGLNLAIGGFVGRQGADVQGTSTYKNTTRFTSLIAYKGMIGKSAFTIGGEYLTAKNFTTALIVSPTAFNHAEGYSLFASVAPAPKWSVFGRYDFTKNSKDLNPAGHVNYYNAGLQYSPAKIVDLALVYKHYQATAGSVLGDLLAGSANRDEVGVFTQFRF
jgi:hypothetical protein